jgi:iron complex transport system ATP-binding protein
MIPGVTVEIGAAAVVLVGERPLRVLSSAVLRGGFVDARAIVNLHVPKNDPCHDPAGMIDDFARRAGVPAPWVGLLTGALTERATVGHEATEGYRATAVTTVGLSNPVAAGHSPIAVCPHSTINTVVVVHADPEPAAMVNAVITATEVKGLVLRAAGIVMPDGAAVSGTSTDAVVIAATGRGPAARFSGPASPLGWVVARAVRAALELAVRDWQARNR